MNRAAAALALLLAAACARPKPHYKHCLKLRVGMTRAAMLQVMGEPEETLPYVEGKSMPHLKGRTAYEWPNPATMPGPNHVSVDEASGLIASISCSNSDITTSLERESPALSTSTAATK